MKFKIKEFVIGIILGGVIFCSISVFAQDIFTAIINPFKVTVNGIEKSIEGYNINGSTYFKLRDIGKYTGFNVDFRENTIMIETNEIVNSKQTSVNTEQYNYVTIDGIEYISAKDVDRIVYQTTNWVFAYSTDKNGAWTNDKGSWCYLNRMEPDIISGKSVEEFEIQCVFIDDISYLTKETFETEVLQRINK